MIQGSNMVLDNKGMRKGISLVEMLIAVILFGVISSIGYKYYKNFYDVSLTAKQARVSAIIDQATQLSNAYDLYAIKTGTTATDINELSASNIGILTETPPAITEISNAGWDLNATYPFNDGTADDVVFIYDMDAAGLNPLDELSYCNILNNVADSTLELNATFQTVHNAYTAGLQTIACGGTGNGDLALIFSKTITP